MKNKIGEAYKDLIEVSRHPNANMELLISDAYNRGYYDGIDAEKKIIIDKINNKD
jgi:hypothetical protein